MLHVKTFIDQIGKVEARVGWFPSALYDDTGTPVAAIAQIMEDGSPRNGIPPRPMFAPTITEQKDNWTRLMGRLANRIVDGSLDVHGAFTALGLAGQTGVQNTIVNLHSPPLSIITLMIRKRKLAGETITGATVRHARKEYELHQTFGADVDVSGVSIKPLIEPQAGGGKMLATLSFVIENL